jgi:xanthine/CO dehydrogenase XdhC/CoxF family maturation factor
MQAPVAFAALLCENPPMRGQRLEVRLDTGLESLLARPPEDLAVLATLVSTAGSTYRKPGARMLLTTDGSFIGLLSGGCLESDLNIHARQVLQSGAAKAVEYDMRGPDDVLFGLGAGCEGAMRVLLEPAGQGTPAAAALAAAHAAAGAGMPASLVSVHHSAQVALGTYHAAAAPLPELAAAADRALACAASRHVEFVETAGRGRAYVQFLAPAPHILICGAGPDAVPVVAAARALGWRVSVVDHRPVYAAAHRFPGARVYRADARDLRATLALETCHAAVVMSHHLASDTAYLQELAIAGVPGYVGLLGPAARRKRIAHELGAHLEELRSRIRGPVGIDIGAVTPEGIALSIISQVHAWLAGRECH